MNKTFKVGLTLILTMIAVCLYYLIHPVTLDKDALLIVLCVILAGATLMMGGSLRS